MTTTEKANRPDAAGHPVAVPTPHDPTAPFYAIGGQDPDFHVPVRSAGDGPGLWGRVRAIFRG